jgi:hypothetical protein
MSLMRLLTVGRSLGLIRDQPSRYKMTQQSLLPKFGPAKSSEAGGPDRDAQPNASEARPDQKSVTTAAAPEVNAAKRKKTMTTVETEYPATPKQAFPAGRWTVFRNPFGFAAVKPKSVVPVQGPVQCELSLDAVKPVRNDLSESDLEVVRAKRAKPDAKSPLTGPVVSPSPESSWDRVTTQFFGAGKS